MKTYINLFCGFLIIILVGCETQNEFFTPELKENIKARVDNKVNTGIVIGLITSEGIGFFSYGVKSLETKEPVDEHTVFEIGSITKTFTGILLANEVVNGELSLNDPLQKLLPEGITAPTRNGEQIKLVNLANHTSALPRVPDNYERIHPENPFADLTIKQTYDFLNTYELPYDIGIHLLNPKSPLKNPKPSIANKLNKVVEKEGIEAAVKTYTDLKKNHPDKYEFQESELNKLAYRYLDYDKIPEALAILKINVEAFPESWAAYDSYGEALMKNNEKEKAIENYNKSLELNSENSNAIKNLKKLGVDIENLDK